MRHREAAAILEVDQATVNVFKKNRIVAGR